MEHVDGVKLSSTIERRDMSRNERGYFIQTSLDRANSSSIGDQSTEEVLAVIAAGFIDVDKTHGMSL
ncbi:hypothetical protein [Leifsonia sp. C5G2]|uniref:hypothetical protein n=1 Tax=Leifsonia sp. C5G2 TaxID=2735269 RepID=UPI0015856834|nr:hypothetical protein [Leifsonia sp. C5G2]NUU06473.1 hypothetical protein [Leifsonia sp. C5G2]